MPTTSQLGDATANQIPMTDETVRPARRDLAALVDMTRRPDPEGLPNQRDGHPDLATAAARTPGTRRSTASTDGQSAV